jgi:hypothetical protein
VPYSPQQNGVSERLNRTLIEKVRCLLHGSQLPNEFWGLALDTAVYLYNRLPHSAIDKVPYTAWNGYEPLMSHLKVFGCLAHSVVLKKSGKLSSEVLSGIFRV